MRLNTEEIVELFMIKSIVMSEKNESIDYTYSAFIENKQEGSNHGTFIWNQSFSNMI